MTQRDRADELMALRQETQEIWEQKADHWDAQMGEGNAFHNQLVAPAAARLLVPQPGETILDVACGNGQFSRQLATLGATVVATDFSATFLARAATRTVALPSGSPTGNSTPRTRRRCSPSGRDASTPPSATWR